LCGSGCREHHGGPTKSTPQAFGSGIFRKAVQVSRVDRTMKIIGSIDSRRIERANTRPDVHG
jgi:hypothetical protein